MIPIGSTVQLRRPGVARPGRRGKVVAVGVPGRWGPGPDATWTTVMWEDDELETFPSSWLTVTAPPGFEQRLAARQAAELAQGRDPSTSARFAVEAAAGKHGAVLAVYVWMPFVLIGLSAGAIALAETVC